MWNFDSSKFQLIWPVKLWDLPIRLDERQVWSNPAKLRLAPQRRRITLSSIHIRGRYALRVTRISPPGSRFTWFAASAERKFILKVRKSMNPEVLGCFSEFSNFFDFSWFWDDLAIIFDCLAWFPARGSFQIDRTSNFKPIQIFTSYGVHVPTQPCTQLRQIFFHFDNMKLRWNFLSDQTSNRFRSDS